MNSKVNNSNLNKKKLLEKKLVIFLVCFMIFIGGGIWFIVSSFDILHEKSITYEESSKVGYSVCLNDNEFYDDKCLNENMSYIASLINNIKLDFNYNFNVSDKDIKGKFSYEVLGKLVIANKDDDSKYFEKGYTLVSKNSDGVTNSDGKYVINRDIDINYDYYNSLSNKFRAEYGVEADSYLDVYFVVYNDMDKAYNLPSSGLTSIRIPLSEKAIRINMDAHELNSNGDNVISNISFDIGNWIYLFIGIILIVLSLFCMVRVLRICSILKKKKSPYDKKLGSIMKTYDRLIANTSTLPNMKDYNVLRIDSFEELVDVRDNLHLPIMYYNVTDHKKCHFYILEDRNLYLYTLMEKENKDE